MRVNACSASKTMKIATCLKNLPPSKFYFLFVPSFPHLQVISSSCPFLPKASCLQLLIHEPYTLTTASCGERCLVANPPWLPHPRRSPPLSTPVARRLSS